MLVLVDRSIDQFYIILFQCQLLRCALRLSLIRYILS